MNSIFAATACSADRPAGIQETRRAARIIAVIIFVVFLVGTATAPRAAAQTLTTLYTFCAQDLCADGANPMASVLVDSKGKLYGTTFYGGAGENAGEVFELTPSAGSSTGYAETVLLSFAAPNNGLIPVAGLVTDAKGNLYGTTSRGGTGGMGTVFKLTPSSTSPGGYVETVLYSFTGGSDGGLLQSGLVMDSKGNLYGTTELSGANGAGVVFEITPSSTSTTGYAEKVLYSFADGNDGGFPRAGLIMDSQGNLYGTAWQGGTANEGTVFELTRSTGSATGYAEKVLYSFAGGSDGAWPWAGLLMDSRGNLYGTTMQGGSENEGTVFELTRSKASAIGYAEKVLYTFTGSSDGGSPNSGLIMDGKGNLFGTTPIGGANAAGTIFEVMPSSASTTGYAEKVLYSFTGGSDGSEPMAGLTMDSSGLLYGTNDAGGANYGTVFQFAPTPQLGIQVIINQVGFLETQGVIKKAQQNALVQPLQHAMQMAGTGKISGAITNLESFINQVNALQNSGVLTSSQASLLTTTATNVVQVLQAI